jgi:hypothetical protein
MKKRGYILLEVVVGGAMAAVLIAGLMTQVASSRQDNVVAGRDVIASVLVTERLEAERSRGHGFSGCAADSSPTVVTGQQGNYTRTCSRAALAESVRGVNLPYDEVTVTVEYKTSRPAPRDKRQIQAVTRVYKQP